MWRYHKNTLYQQNQLGLYGVITSNQAYLYEIFELHIHKKGKVKVDMIDELVLSDSGIMQAMSFYKECCGDFQICDSFVIPSDGVVVVASRFARVCGKRK